MDDLHIGAQSVRFDAPPSILSFAAIGGKKEQEGPLASYFDFLSGDTTFGQKSWEKAESELQKRALPQACPPCPLPLSWGRECCRAPRSPALRSPGHT